MNLSQMINICEKANVLAEIYEDQYDKSCRLLLNNREEAKPYLTRKVLYVETAVDRNFLNDGRPSLIILVSKTEVEGTDSIFDHPTVLQFIDILKPTEEFRVLNYMTKNALVMAITIDDEYLGFERPVIVIEPAETIVSYVNPFEQT